jgi:hypothetical protein
VVMGILSLVQAGYILMNWGGLVPHQSVFWMNDELSFSLLTNDVSVCWHVIQRVWTNLCPQQSSYHGKSSMCIVPAATRNLYCARRPCCVCMIHYTNGAICQYTTFLVANRKQLFNIK